MHEHHHHDWGLGDAEYGEIHRSLSLFHVGHGGHGDHGDHGDQVILMLMIILIMTLMILTFDLEAAPMVKMPPTTDKRSDIKGKLENKQSSPIYI